MFISSESSLIGRYEQHILTQIRKRSITQILFLYNSQQLSSHHKTIEVVNLQDQRLNFGRLTLTPPKSKPLIPA